MSWRESLQPGSFRGVPFNTKAHEGEFGRRVQVHEFPLRDKPFVEDLGRKGRAISVEAFVLGDDYMVQRDQLLAAVEKPGAGPLVHPYLGKLQATVTRCRLSESTAEGGMATFQLEFMEAGADAVPTNQPGTTVAVATTAANAQAAVSTSFAKRVSVPGRPAYVGDAASQIFTTATAQIRTQLGTVLAPAAEAAALQLQLANAERDVLSLLYQPATAAATLLASVQQMVRGVATTARDAVNLAQPLFGFGASLAPVAATTSNRAVQAQNQAELVQLVRVAAVSEAAQAATTLAFDSYDDAIAVRDQMVDALDDVMISAADDTVYDALRALRAAVVRDVAARGGDLARVVQWTPLVTMPALVAAQALYADATRADELLTRNAVRHPLFVPGARPLQVLGDGL